MDISSSLIPLAFNEIGGIALGHWTDLDAATGCTVVVCPEGAVGGVDVRGGAPATRETDLLRAEEMVEKVHAVVLAGGSLYGLEAASGVARELERRGIGLPVGVGVAPIVCSACLFDLACGRADIRPDVDAGVRAVKDALDPPLDAPVSEGCVGAGTGATVGKLAGPQRAMKSGVGARAFALGSLQVGAVAAVNACGNVCDPSTHTMLAGLRASASSYDIIDMEEEMLRHADTLSMPLSSRGARTNTTISCVVTNANLTKAQATKVAQMAADAYAHTIRPTHTTNDGDTIFVLATATRDASGADESETSLDLIGLLATRALEAAIVAGVSQATSLAGVPAACDVLR